MTEIQWTEDNVGVLVNRERNRANLSLRGLADQLGISHMSIWRAERGEWPTAECSAPLLGWLAASLRQAGEGSAASAVEQFVAQARQTAGKAVRVWLDDALLDAVERECERLEVTRSAIVRLALRGKLKLNRVDGAEW